MDFIEKNIFDEYAIEELSNLYWDLYNSVKNNVYRNHIDRQTKTTYVGGAGLEYRKHLNDDNYPRLMVIGRAPDDWYKVECNGQPYKDEDKESYKNVVRAFLKRSEEDGIYWAKLENGRIVNKNYNSFTQLYTSVKSVDFIETANSGKFEYAKSYTNVVLPVLVNLLNDVGDDSLDIKDPGFWFDRVAWSNLYKISPNKEGKNPANPSKRSKEWQNKIAADILKKEIEIYKPTHILFITDIETKNEKWFYYFPSYLPINFKQIEWGYLDKGYIFIKRNDGSIPVNILSGVGVWHYENMNTAKVIVSTRPENMIVKPNERSIKRYRFVPKDSMQARLTKYEQLYADCVYNCFKNHESFMELPDGDKRIKHPYDDDSILFCPLYSR